VIAVQDPDEIISSIAPSPATRSTPRSFETTM